MTEFKRGRKQVKMAVEVQDGFTLKDFLSKVETMMTGFDPEYLDKLEIVFETYFESYEVQMVLSHWRPETDKEMEERATTILQAQSAQESKERRQLAALQRKYT